jgi:hypothetical protein
LLAGLLACLLAGVLPGPTPARAQSWMWYGSTSNYVNITEAKVERLSNAVRIILQADGTLETNADYEQFFHYDAEINDWNLTETKRFTLNLVNARSQIGRYVDVGMYPASHVTLSVPTEATQGVGIAVTTSLYAPAVVGRVSAWGSTDDFTFATWFDRRIDMVLSDDRRQLIITCLSDLPYDPELAAKAPPTPTHAQLAVERMGADLRLRALNAPLADVAAEVTAKSELQVAVGPGVEKRITASLPAMPAEKLMATLCRASCLGFTRQDGHFIISAGSVDDVAPYWTAETRRIHLNNVSVDDAVLMLPTFILPHVQPDTESNSVVASGPPVMLDKIARDLAAVDQPGRQIVMQAMLVEIMSSPQAERTLTAIVEGGTSSYALSPSTGFLRLAVSNLSLDNISLRLHSLAARGAVRLQVQPRTAVISGRRARLFVGSQVLYPYVRSYWWGTDVSVQKLDVGVSLTTTPWAGDEHTVTVPYTLSSGTIAAHDAKGLPWLSRQSAEGSLRVTDGQTIIFAGLRARDRQKARSSFSPLDSAGIVGDLLADQTRADEDHEVLMCLSARVLAAPPLAERPREPVTAPADVQPTKPPPWLMPGGPGAIRLSSPDAQPSATHRGA